MANRWTVTIDCAHPPTVAKFWAPAVQAARRSTCLPCAVGSALPGERNGARVATPRNRVIVWEDGRPVHPDVIRQRFNRLSLRCGLPHIRLHDIRHSYATAALEAGVHLKIVSARLGHASETFTASVYQHALPGMDREAAGTIAALFLGDGATGQIASESVSRDDENGQPDDL